jgi:hypothetical protein
VEPFQNQNVNNLLVGTGTGVVVLAMTNPFWVVKTRLCLQYENQGVRKYSGMIDCYRKILRYEGWMGLYKVALYDFLSQKPTFCSKIGLQKPTFTKIQTFL